MIAKVSGKEFENNFILIVPFDYSLNDFLSASQVSSGSYASELMMSVYKKLIKDSIELTYEFNTYYYMEYENLFDYLSKKYNINTSIISRIKNSYTDSAKIYFGSASSYNDYNLGELIYNDNFFNVLIKIFGK